MSAPTPAAVKKTLDEKRASGITPPVAIISEKTTPKYERPERLTQRPFSNDAMKKLRESFPENKRTPRKGTSKESTTKPAVRKDAKENN